MSVEYLRCKGCGKIESDCYMSHTPKGSYCYACYKQISKPIKPHNGVPIVEGTKHDPGFIGFDYCDEYCNNCGEYTHNVPVDRVSLCAYCQAEIFPCTCCEDDCDFSREKNGCHRFKYTL